MLMLFKSGHLHIVGQFYIVLHRLSLLNIVTVYRGAENSEAGINYSLFKKKKKLGVNLHNLQ